jgi:hypothetical protein
MEKIARFQFGVVGVGSGSKAHLVFAYVNEKGEASNVHIECGSQKWAGNGRSRLWAFKQVSDVIEKSYQVAEDADEFEERIAKNKEFYAAKKANFIAAFDVAIEKWGSSFCSKCLKSGRSYKHFILEGKWK